MWLEGYRRFWKNDEPSISFYVSCDLWPCHLMWPAVWQHDLVTFNPNPGSKNRIKENNPKENQIRKEKWKILSPLLSFLTLSPLQGFSSRETNFHFCQFLSNFLRYSSSNFPSSHLYNIFAINFPGDSPLLKCYGTLWTGTTFIFFFFYFLTL